jgi:hypothetical protein
VNVETLIRSARVVDVRKNVHEDVNDTSYTIHLELPDDADCIALQVTISERKAVELNLVEK